MGVLHRGHRHLRPLHRRVGTTLDEVKARHRRQAHDFINGEHHRFFYQTIDHEAVLGGVDVPPTLVVALEMQTAGGDDAKQGLQRCKRHRSLGGLRQARALAALHIGLEPRGLAVAIGGHAQTQTLGVLGQVQDVGVAPFWGHRVGLGQGSPTRGRHRCGKRFFNETTPTLAQLAAGGLQSWRVQKVFRRFAQAAMGGGWVHFYINKD